MGKPGIPEFANALQEWAAQDEQRETLVKWLLSRTESRGFKAPCKSSGPKDPDEEDKYVVKRANIEDVDIEKAVIRAMAGYNPDLPTSGWVRGGPLWPKAYGNMWPKGYGS